MSSQLRVSQRTGRLEGRTLGCSRATEARIRPGRLPLIGDDPLTACQDTAEASFEAMLPMELRRLRDCYGLGIRDSSGSLDSFSWMGLPGEAIIYARSASCDWQQAMCCFDRTASLVRDSGLEIGAVVIAGGSGTSAWSGRVDLHRVLQCLKANCNMVVASGPGQLSRSPATWLRFERELALISRLASADPLYAWSAESWS